MKRTTIYLAPEMHDRLTVRAQQDGTVIADLVRRALDVLLDDLERWRTQTRGVAEAAAAYRTRAGEATADMRRTTMHLPDDTRHRLADAAAVHGKSQAELIREAVEEYLDNLERPWPRSIGIADDPDLSGAEAKDWLRRTWLQHIEARWDGSPRA